MSESDSQSLDQSFQEAVRQLEEKWLELSSRSSFSSRRLYAAVRRTLYMDQLNNDFSEDIILNEAMERAVSITRRGGVIHDLPAWLRTTAINIIRKKRKSRDREKLVSLDHEAEQVGRIELPEDSKKESSHFDASVSFVALLEARPHLERDLRSLAQIWGIRKWSEHKDIESLAGQNKRSEHKKIAPPTRHNKRSTYQKFKY